MVIHRKEDDERSCPGCGAPRIRVGRLRGQRFRRPQMANSTAAKPARVARSAAVRSSDRSRSSRDVQARPHQNLSSHVSGGDSVYRGRIDSQDDFDPPSAALVDCRKTIQSFYAVPEPGFGQPYGARLAPLFPMAIMSLLVFSLVSVSPVPALADEPALKCESIAVYGENSAENDALRKCDVAKVSCGGVTYYLDKDAEAAPKATLDVVDANGKPVQVCSSKSHPIALQLDLNLLDSINSQSAEAGANVAEHLDAVNASLHDSGLGEGYALQACAWLVPGTTPVGDRIKSCVRPDREGHDFCDGSSPQCGQFCWCQKGIGNLGMTFRTRHVPISGTCPANLKELELNNPLPAPQGSPSELFKTFSLKISGKIPHLAFTRAQLEALEIKPLGPATAFSCFYDCQKQSDYFAQFDGTGTFCSAAVSQCKGVSFNRDQPVRPMIVGSDGLQAANCLIKGSPGRSIGGFPLGRVSSACPDDVDRCMNNAQWWSQAPEMRTRLGGYGGCMRDGAGYSRCIEQFRNGASQQGVE